MTKRVSVSFLVITLMLAFIGCNRSPQAKKPEEQRQLKTSKVSCHEVPTYIEATGSVQPDLTGTSKINSQLPGIVGQINVKVGDRVNRGSALLMVKSPEATDTYSNYLSTFAQLKQAERIYSLNKQLFEVGAITKNDLLNSESAYRQLDALKEGLKRKLHLYGCPVEDDGAATKLSCSDTLTVKASIDGYVADILAHVGDRVDTTTPLMVIADPQNIVVVANIYDTDIPRVSKGSTVRFSTDTFPEQSFSGLITYISDISDTEAKTVKTFIKLQGRKDLFKQNMFLKIRIEQQKRLLPVIPQSAMIYKEGKFYVYVPGKDRSYNLKEIRPVREVPEKSVAVEGLKEGDDIIVSAIELERP